VPPFTAVGVNVTVVPGHIAPDGDAAMETEGVSGAVSDRLPKFVPLVPVVIPAIPVTEDA
jgi:hypothetical protein